MLPSMTSLSKRIENAVVHNPHLNVRKMHFVAVNDRVIINGNVQSYFEKQMAQETIKRIDGVNSVVNQLEVCWTP